MNPELFTSPNMKRPLLLAEWEVVNRPLHCLATRRHSLHRSLAFKLPIDAS
jgi:hypothetical protein